MRWLAILLCLTAQLSAQDAATRLLILEQPIDPDARDWRNRVQAQGGSVSSSTLRIESQANRKLKAAGLWSKIYYDLRVVGDDLIAARVPMVVGVGSAIATGFNLVSGDYSERGTTGGIKGNGTNKYLDLGWNPVTAGASVSSLTLSAYASAQTDANNSFVGAFNGSGNLLMGYIASVNVGRVASQSAENANIGGSGLISVETNGSRSMQGYGNGVAVGSPTTATAAFPDLSLYALARNGGPTPSLHSTRYLLGVRILTGLSASEMLTLYQIEQERQAAYGRQVTP